MYCQIDPVKTNIFPNILIRFGSAADFIELSKNGITNPKAKPKKKYLSLFSNFYSHRI